MGRDLSSGRVFPQDGKGGIYLTEYVATAALQGIIAAHGAKGISAGVAASKAVEYAKALVACLKK